MILIFKILTIVLVCIFTVYILSFAIRLIQNLSIGSFLRQNREKQINIVKNKTAGYISALSLDPSSRVSRKILLYISGIVFLLSFLMLGRILFALICSGLSYYTIFSYFKKQLTKRHEAFESQLMEFLTNISNSVKAGQSLLQAVENSVKGSKPPISTEFGNVLNRVNLGIPLDKALLEMTALNPSKDLKITVTSINLVKETGGNIGEMLTRISHTISERKRVKSKISALTSQGKASGMIMSAIPFLLLIVLYLMEPAMTGLLFSTTLGNVMLVIVVLMIAAGTFFTRKIINIDF